jgi:histone H1/5
MKAVVALVLCAALAAVVNAQGLKYEQVAYSDAAAPVEQPMELVESDAEVGGAPSFSDMAHKAKNAVAAVKKLFDKKKEKGGNVSPSAPPPQPAAKAAARKGARAQRRAEKRAAKVAARKAGHKAARAERKAAKKAARVERKAERKALKVGRKASKAERKAQRKAAAHKAARKARKALKKIVRRRKHKALRLPKPPAAARGDHLWHSERFDDPKSPNADPEMAKLNLALEAVKEDILATNKQINDERRWVIAVSKIIKSYTNKMQRVEAHIIALRKEMKALYRKKKQIENLKLQKALQAKLKEARAELATLMNSLKHVARKQGELNKSGRDLRQTIAGIQGQLAKLRGQRMFKKCKAGTKYSRKAKKCKSVCKKGSVYNRKTKKCVARCRKGLKWNGRTKKCVKKPKGKGKGKGKGKRKAK